MKLLFIRRLSGTICCLICTILLFSACSSAPNYKVVRQEVMDLHDRLMVDGEQAIKNRLKLDTLFTTDLVKFKIADTAAEKVKIQALIKKLDRTDEEMLDWMHFFQADIAGKTNDQAVAYFKSEMIKVKALDKHYRAVLEESNAYLKQLSSLAKP